VTRAIATAIAPLAAAGVFGLNTPAMVRYFGIQ
jgi:hypothetical protein